MCKRICAFGIITCLMVFIGGCDNLLHNRASDSVATEEKTKSEDITSVKKENRDEKKETGREFTGQEKYGLEIEQRKEEEQPVKLLFAGDLLMDWSTKETMKIKGVDYPFQFVKDEIEKADVAFVNLENPLTTRGEEEKDTDQLFNFKADPNSIQGVIHAGFDIVNLANNHTLDYGRGGLIDTINTLNKVNLPYIGAGRTKEEAFQAKVIEVKGMKIGFIGATRFVPNASWYSFYEGVEASLAGAYDVEELARKVREEKQKVDYLVLYLHWGKEKTDVPQPYQIKYLEKLTEAGADAIIGSHPHWLQGFTYHDGVPVAFSLGNFLFPSYVTGKSAETGLLTLTIHKEQTKMNFHPFQIKNDQIVPMGKEQETALLKRLEGLSQNVTINGYQIIPNNK